MLKKRKDLFILVGIITLISILIFLPYLIKSEVFYLGWDVRTQYSSFFEELRTVLQQSLQEHKLPFYSWNYFLGNNFYSSKLFYYHDFLDWFFALFTNWSYNNVIIVQTYIKFLISGLTFYAYCSYNKYSSKTRIIGSLLYTFSAFGISIMMHPFFATFFVFLPLYFLSIDHYLYKGKKVGYILITTFLIIINYYLFYSLSVFTIIYFIYRYRKQNNIYKGVIKKALPLIGSYFVAVLLSSVVFIPEVMQILQNQRVGDSGSLLVYENIIPYFSIITGLFTPTSIVANRTDAIGTLYAYTSSNNSLMPVYLNITALGTVLLTQIIKDKTKLIFLGIIFILLFIPFGSSLMHGLSEPSFRWLGFASFLLIIMILDYIENLSLIDKSLMKKTLIIISVILIIATPIIAIIQQVNINEILPWYLIIFIMTIPFFILYYHFINTKFITIILVLEIILVTYFSYAKNDMFTGFTKNNIYASTHVLGNKNDLINYLNEYDETNNTSFYRIYVDPSSIYWDYSSNYNLNYNFMGVLSYDTTYEFAVDDMREIAKIDTYLPWAFDIRDDNLLDMLSVKYAITSNETTLPENGNYKLVTDFNGIPIYENLDYVNLGKTYTKISTYDNQLNNSIICHEEDKEEIQKLIGNAEITFDNVIRKQNYLYAGITLNENGFALLSIPYDTGWSITVNGNEVKSYKVNGGLTGIALESGYNEIEMYYVPNDLKIGAIATAIGTILTIAVYIKDRRK